jgi:hypothetical protein
MQDDVHREIVCTLSIDSHGQQAHTCHAEEPLIVNAAIPLDRLCQARQHLEYGQHQERERMRKYGQNGEHDAPVLADKGSISEPLVAHLLL